MRARAPRASQALEGSSLYQTKFWAYILYCKILCDMPHVMTR